MNNVLVVFVIAGLVSILTAACEHAGTELSNELGCHLAGNSCPSVNLDDPNLRGASGRNGTDGLNGTTGPQGLPGERGPIGPGEAFSFVQLCPGVVATYPSAFPEVAICTGVNLYGVFSANNGFLTLFPPGRYSSNAIGSNCSFTIQQNCVVIP